MDYTKDFLGRGWAFPIGTNKATGRVELAQYEQDISQAIKIILATRPGERVMRPSFGSGLHNYIFAADSFGTRAKIKKEAEDALRLWEMRISDVKVDVSFPRGSLSGFVLDISYIVRSTNNPFNLVYPYFLTERA